MPSEIYRCFVVKHGRALVLGSDQQANPARWPMALEQAIRSYIDIKNAKPKPFIWTKTADQILESIARFCKRTSNSGH
jgi:hypothetical protein